MLAPGDRVIAAVSGGADSVCLLHVLLELAPRLGIAVSGVAHLNHKLRGEASERDERFVAALAETHTLRLYREEARVADAPGNLEQAARLARRNFFARLIADGAADKIATGHTRDDQAETVLFRAIRGTGLAGLAGILPVTAEGLIRPLLGLGRSEIEQFLQARGIAWREDASNQDPRFARNRIRHDLLPKLAREWNPRVSEALARIADLAFEEERWWAAETKRRFEHLFTAACGGWEARAETLAALPRAVARRVARHAIAQVAGGLPAYEDIERLLELARRREGRGRLEFAGAAAARSFGWLRLSRKAAEPTPEPVWMQGPGGYSWDGGRLFLEICETKSRRAGCASLKLNAGRLAAPLELRGWRAGDHYRPAGSSRDQKIKDLFQSAQVPSWRRPFWPIVTSSSKIVWARDFGAAADSIARGDSGPVLRIWEENTAGG